MQDRYAGDVGDFGKLGLLRHLCGVTAHDDHPQLKPGVIWYKTIPGKREEKTPDGEFTQYLVDSDENYRRFKTCDADLYEALRHIVTTGRSIEHLQTVLEGQCPDFGGGVPLLPDAEYWQGDVGYGKKQATCPRADWFHGAAEATAGCDLVFLDPDNGVECADLRPTQGKSRKYVFRCEIGELIKRGHSAVVYHHTGFSMPVEEQVTRHLRTLADQIELPERPFGVLFRRRGVRAFLILPNQGHRQMLLERTNALIQKWSSGSQPGPHFTGPILI